MKQVQLMPLMWISQKRFCGFCSLNITSIQGTVWEDLTHCFVFDWGRLQEKATLYIHFRLSTLIS